MEIQEKELALAMQWFEHQHACHHNASIAYTDSDISILTVDTMELLYWNPALAKAIMHDPDFVAFKLCNFMFSSIDHPCGKRMWLRFDCVPLPLVPAEKLWKTGAARGPNRVLVHTYGVVYAASALRTTEYMRSFRCKGCGFAKNFSAYERVPFGRICCSYGKFEEDKSASIYISCQEIQLGPVPTLSSKALPLPQMIVVVLQDDLAGKVQIGDSVAVIGHASVDIGEVPSSMQERCIGYIKVTANNITCPFNFRSFGLPSQIDLCSDRRFLDDAGHISLNKLCKVLYTEGEEITLNVYSRVALLLSLVASEHAANFHSNERKQIHLLLTNAAPCESLLRQMTGIAIVYASRSVRHSPSSKNLLPKIRNSSTGAHHVLQSGSLSRSNDGVFLVDFFTCPISRSEIREFCEALEKPSIPLKETKDLHIPCRSTVWGTYTLLYGQPSIIPSNFRKSKGPALDPKLVARFDIILSAEEEDNRMKENNMAAESGRPSQVVELQRHLLCASNIESVKTSEGAENLIGAYYVALRKEKAKSFMMKSDDAFCLQSLLRVASACARLCLRDKILEFPDATLAILLCEKTHAAKFGLSAMEHSAPTRSEKTLDIDIIDFYQYLMQKLMPLQPSSQDFLD